MNTINFEEVIAEENELIEVLEEYLEEIEKEIKTSKGVVKAKLKYDAYMIRLQLKVKIISRDRAMIDRDSQRKLYQDKLGQMHDHKDNVKKLEKAVKDKIPGINQHKFNIDKIISGFRQGKSKGQERIQEAEMAKNLIIELGL